MIRQLALFLVLIASSALSMGSNMTFMEEVPKDFKIPAPESDYDKNLLKQIEELGWHNLHVGEENGLPSFSFSLGHFYKSNHPEIIIIGLPPETANQLLNIAVVKVVGAKDKIEPYRKYKDFTEGLSVAFVPVNLEHYGEYLGYANWFYGSMKKPYPALQMVWPDREGKYPWEKGYDERFLQIQPILGKMP
jgi:hypothetical protein